MKWLVLDGYAVELLPKLRFREENQVEKLLLSAEGAGQIKAILEAENQSIWIGKVKKLVLYGYAVKLLSKLGFHEETQMEELSLGAEGADQITEIRKTEDRSIWVGKVKSLDLT
ncbi:MAG: uncharacterized protein A8A55_3235, partial [Amphiamblys sp. WSBS2006]